MQKMNPRSAVIMSLFFPLTGFYVGLTVARTLVRHRDLLPIGGLISSMQLFADVLNNLLHSTAIDFALLDFASASVDDFVPVGFGVGVHGGAIETGEELAGVLRPGHDLD
jgi:hypothetical protein